MTGDKVDASRLRVGRTCLKTVDRSQSQNVENCHRDSRQPDQITFKMCPPAMVSRYR